MIILLSYVQILKQSAADYLKEPSYASQVHDHHIIIVKLANRVDMQNTVGSYCSENIWFAGVTAKRPA
jgi:hypothetical protein